MPALANKLMAVDISVPTSAKSWTISGYETLSP